ncbi:response regulator [Acidocella sp. MX-AZ03]|nr:response regulator [Acidocella sp. MX-AZ03]WBO59426.1 response regulator [Acidocella sp. MX-AZ03]
MASIAHLLCDVLKETGYDVVGPVATCVDAAKLVASSQLDAALLDIHLTDGTSYSLAASLVAQNLPFAFMSGDGAGYLPPEFCDRPTIGKPMSFDALLKMVEMLCASSMAGSPESKKIGI